MINTATGTNIGFEDETAQSMEFAIAYATYNAKNPSSVVLSDSVVTGILVSKDGRLAIIDINNKAQVSVPVDSMEKSILDGLEVGSSTQVYITSITDSKREYTITGSLHRIRMIEVDNVLRSAYENRTIMTGTPTEYNDAGYTVLVYVNDEEVAMFMPHILTDVNKLPDPASIIGQEINFFIEKSIENKTSMLASRKAYLKTLISAEIKKLVKKELYNGHVTGTAPFGVFVQFNEALTGMIHKSNLSAQAQELLEKGEISNGTTIEFFVKDIDVEKKKIFLTQVLRESLWDSIQIDDILPGKVISVKQFGLLVELDYDTKGFVYETQLNKPLSSYKPGMEFDVYVRSIDKNKRQIALGLN